MGDRIDTAEVRAACAAIPGLIPLDGRAFARHLCAANASERRQLAVVLRDVPALLDEFDAARAEVAAAKEGNAVLFQEQMVRYNACAIARDAARAEAERLRAELAGWREDCAALVAQLPPCAKSGCRAPAVRRAASFDGYLSGWCEAHVRELPGGVAVRQENRVAAPLRRLAARLDGAPREEAASLWANPRANWKPLKPGVTDFRDPSVMPEDVARAVAGDARCEGCGEPATGCMWGGSPRRELRRPRSPRTGSGAGAGADARGGPMIIHAESHLDHALTPAHVDWLCTRFAKRATFFAETIELPPELAPLPCGLHGPVMGDAPVPDAECRAVVRGARKGPSRLCDRRPRDSRLVTVIAGPYDGHACVLFTAYGGPQAPPEPWDAPPNTRATAEAFWAEHALSADAS